MNLPVILISTSKLSKYYGTNKIAATIAIGEASYQYLMDMPNSDQNHYVSDFTSGVIAAASNSAPLYSVDGRLISVYSTDHPEEIRVQDKYGTSYIFRFTVLYGYKGINIYDPTYNSSNKASADQALVYRIQHIYYPNGQALSFTYTDTSWISPQTHSLAISDTIGNLIATLDWNTLSGTVSIANQSGNLTATHRLIANSADYRIGSIENLITARSICFDYIVNQAVPYSWQNQTSLAKITNAYTGHQTSISYQQYNTNDAYDAGCNKFSLAEIAIFKVANSDANNNFISQAAYDFGFDSDINFVMPQSPVKKTFASGLNHWLDNLFYDNKDSDGCSAADLINAAECCYKTTITTTFPDSARNRRQDLVYDALGRKISETTIPTNGPSKAWLTSATYTYQDSVYSIKALKSFTNLPFSYGSPTRVASFINPSTLNGVALQADELLYVQEYLYDDAGNPIQEVSPLGQRTEYTYLPLSYTNPQNERLVSSVKTYSIGENAASYVLESLSYQNLCLQPTDGASFMPIAVSVPSSNVEIHYDAATDSTYTYRTDSTAGYLGGYNYSTGADVGLNGMLTLRTQEDNTGISDVTRLQTKTIPSFVSIEGHVQPVLNIASTITGTTKSGNTTSLNRGSGLLNFMGYALQQTNTMGQISSQTFDSLGRLTSVSTLTGTEFAQTISYAYDLEQDLELVPWAYFSCRRIDAYRNIYVQLYDARQRHIADYQTLNGCLQVQTAAYTYDDANNLIQATCFGNGYQYAKSYYYSPGTHLLLATVPSYGLAQGQIIDGRNGVTFRFNYAPQNDSATCISSIHGPLQITQINNTSQLVLADGLLDADVASKALAGFDLINGIKDGIPYAPLDNNIWVQSGTAPEPLIALYQAAAYPQWGTPDASSCNLMAYNSYKYDEWNRRVATTHVTFINHEGPDGTATPTFTQTTTATTFDTAQRSVTCTYPQGQQKSTTFNLLNGIQSASFTVNDVTTQLGEFLHDGLGRMTAYLDRLNGSQRTATYTDLGLLASQSDAYGNTTTYTYDSVSFKLIHTVLSSAVGGSPVIISRQYDSHLKPIWVGDDRGNNDQWAYADNGLLLTQSITLGSVNPGNPYQTAFTYDNYGDLIQLADPFLPFPEINSINKTCTMVRSNVSVHGFSIGRDAFGRISHLVAESFHGVSRSFSYDPTTGVLVGDDLSNLPPTFGCGDTGSLNLSTTYSYDNNLRTISKTVARSDLSGPTAVAMFAQAYDRSNRVARRTRMDCSGAALSESFTYDLHTGALQTYANNGESASPCSYLPLSAPVQTASYAYDLYGNIVQAQYQGVSNILIRNYFYDLTRANPFQLIGIEEVLGTGETYQGTCAYDCAGNTVTDAYGRTFAYDIHGLVQSIQRADHETETFIRSGQGRLIGRTAPWLNGTVYRFGRAQFHEERLLWQTRFFGGTACYVGGNGRDPGPPQAVTEQQAFIDLEDLGLRPVMTLTYGSNSAGFELAGTSSFLPYGTSTDLHNSACGYPANLDNPADYPESIMGSALGADVGTGLRHLGEVRAYDPVLGRFLQWDPMAPLGKGGLNGYAYAGNDPVNYWDPTGHYRSVRARRFGPKPIEAHHPHSDDSFWDGLLAGFKHGVKAFFMSPYNYVKNFGEDLAHHRWVGALEMGFNAGFETVLQVELGMAGTMILEEFITLSPSSIFTGKSPVGTASKKKNAYQWGYSLGNTSGELFDTGALAAVTFGVGLVASATVASFAGVADEAAAAADAEVVADATNTSRTELEEPANASLERTRVSRLVSADDSALNPHDSLSSTRATESEADDGSEDVTRFPRLRRVAQWIGNNSIFRNVILPHDPQDPFPWDEGLTPVQRAKAIVTVTSEAFSQSRAYLNRLATWGGVPLPSGTTASPSTSTTTNTQGSDGQGLDQLHQQPDGSTSTQPFLPPALPPTKVPRW